MTNQDEEPELPVHITLGMSNYAKIRTETRPKTGSPGEPVAELIKVSYTVMLPGKEVDISSFLLTQTTAADCEQLCKLTCLDFSTRQSVIKQTCIRVQGAVNSKCGGLVRDRSALERKPPSSTQ